MKKEFSTNDHIHPDNGKNPHNQDSPQNGTWNDHQLEQLFGEALGDIPTADETRKAWQTFIRRHRIRHQSIRRITIPGIAAAVIALVLVFQPFLQPEPQEVEVFTSLEVPEEITFGKKGKDNCKHPARYHYLRSIKRRKQGIAQRKQPSGVSKGVYRYHSQYQTKRRGPF